jgi:hypothetical protein
MPGTIGGGIVVIGFFAFIIGAILFAAEVKSRGTVEIPGLGSFSGPVWFIMMIVGILMMVGGWSTPF